MILDKNTPCIEPLYDTWGAKDIVGTWAIYLSFDFTDISPEKINNWFANKIVLTLESFSELVRIRKIFLNEISIVGQDKKCMSLDWQESNSYEEYLDNALKTIREHSVAIDRLTISMDMLVFVRTEESPNQPIRAWAKNLGEFEISLEPEDRKPYIYLAMDHTLFYPFHHLCDENNNELFSLNQPLLENALRRWEEKCGEISEIDGLKGIYKYGFLPEEEWDKS